MPRSLLCKYQKKHYSELQINLLKQDQTFINVVCERSLLKQILSILSINTVMIYNNPTCKPCDNNMRIEYSEDFIYRLIVVTVMLFPKHQKHSIINTKLC